MKQLSQVDPSYKWMQQWRSQVDIGCVCVGGGLFIYLCLPALKNSVQKKLKNAEDEYMSTSPII